MVVRGSGYGVAEASGDSPRRRDGGVVIARLGGTTRTAAAGAMLAFAGALSFAAIVPLDRPTPAPIDVGSVPASDLAVVYREIPPRALDPLAVGLADSATPGSAADTGTTGTASPSAASTPGPAGSGDPTTGTGTSTPNGPGAPTPAGAQEGAGDPAPTGPVGDPTTPTPGPVPVAGPTAPAPTTLPTEERVPGVPSASLPLPPVLPPPATVPSVTVPPLPPTTLPAPTIPPLLDVVIDRLPHIGLPLLGR